jgi:hypothetical protein
LPPDFAKSLLQQLLPDVFRTEGFSPLVHHDTFLFRQWSIAHKRQTGANKTITEACSLKETLAIVEENRL